MNKPALIIGSGPSVNKLKGEHLAHFETYGCNSIYSKFKEWGREVDNVIITDSTRLREIGNAYSDYKGNLFIGDERMILPKIKRTRKIIGRDFIPLRQLTKKSLPKWLPIKNKIIPKYLRTLIFDKLSASFDYTYEGFNFGSSVSSSAVQLAVTRKHTEIYLIGIDARYRNEKDYFSSMKDKVEMVNHSFIQNPRLMMEPFFVMSQILMETYGATLTDLSEGDLKFVKRSTIDEVLEKIKRVVI